MVDWYTEHSVVMRAIIKALNNDADRVAFHEFGIVPVAAVADVCSRLVRLGVLLKPVYVLRSVMHGIGTCKL